MRFYLRFEWSLGGNRRIGGSRQGIRAQKTLSTDELGPPVVALAPMVRFEGNNWTHCHLDWLGGVQLPERVAQTVLLDGIGSIDALLVRRESLKSRMSALAEGSPWEQASLTCAACAASTP